MATLCDINNATKRFSLVQSFAESMSNSPISQAIQRMQIRSSIISSKIQENSQKCSPISTGSQLMSPYSTQRPVAHEPALGHIGPRIVETYADEGTPRSTRCVQPAPPKPARRRARKRGNRVTVIGLLEQELENEVKSRIQIIEEAWKNGWTPVLPRLTQYQLAERLDTSPPTITRIFQSDSCRPLKMLFNRLQHADSLLELQDNYLRNTH